MKACHSAKANNAVSECVRQTMYDSFGNIQLGMKAQAADESLCRQKRFPHSSDYPKAWNGWSDLSS